jgi:(E)-4-hydroxy-3-methylbut-2-enyl-diphosphate synthase
MQIRRRKTRKIKIGSLYVGGDAPIAIQSMAKTDTRNTRATIAEIQRLERAGCELVRVAVKDTAAVRALPEIRRKIHIPLVADIHFNPQLAQDAIKCGVDKVRINPGTIRSEAALKDIARAARRRRIPIRIGFNSGSLPSGKNILECAAQTVKLFEECRFYDIIISLKTSDVRTTVAAYRAIASRCHYPLHVGMTATGLPESGIVKSSIGIGALLLEGVGDTIRVSLTSNPVDEVQVAKAILSSLGLRNFGHEILSCPTCGRCQVNLMAIVRELQDRLNVPHKKRHPRRTMRIAVMGCEVNGPGEARDADIGIAAGKGSGALFRKGRIVRKIKEKDFVRTLISEINRGKV